MQLAAPSSFLNSTDSGLKGECLFLNLPAATNDGNGPARTPGRGKRRGSGGGGGGERGRGVQGPFVTNSRVRGRGVGKKDGSNLMNCGPSRSPNRKLERSGETTTTLAPEDSQYSIADSDDADSFTCKEVLMLLAASGDVTMQRELAKFLQSEAKESQERSVAKVHGWLQSQVP